MLVEDDKSLREIYGVRLLAEGYDIVSAGDGEEALAMAIKERPQLIISDVMMPKVSGYDMLDILRSTTETKNIRVIMMTALSSEEQRARAESLGADRYLVKSQVGIEDVVRVVHEVLEDAPVATPAAAPAPTPAPPLTVAARPATITPAPVSYPAAAPAPAFIPAPVATPLPAPMAAPTPLPSPAAPPNVMPTLAAPKMSDTPKPASIKTRIIQPLSDPSISPVNINDLLDKELAKEAGITDTERPAVESINQERAEVAAQLQSFTPPELTPVTPPAYVAPTMATPATPSLLPMPGVGAQQPMPTPVAFTPPVITSPVADTTPPPVPMTPPQAPLASVSPIQQPVTQVTTPVSPQPFADPSAPVAPTQTLPEIPRI